MSGRVTSGLTGARRVTTRTNDLPGFPLPTWDQVQTMASQYETRDDERLVLDTRRDLDACVHNVLDYLDHPSAPTTRPDPLAG
ncbi:MAG TPA: hypothetical protein VI110_04140 [Lapillicoccus sp.]